MTMAKAQARLDSFLESCAPKVTLLKGDWGSGKTYQWRLAVKRSAQKGSQQRIAYVSMFGLATLTEVRKRIFEESVASVRLGTHGVAADVLDPAGFVFKPTQLLKLAPVIPYLGKLESLVHELSFSSVRNMVVCFDDVERAGKTLNVAEILGLATFLKEERGCRVLLISNDARLDGTNKKDLSTYSEKVIDEIVTFAPSPVEAREIGLGPTPSETRAHLGDDLVGLGVSNIRVISKLASLADEVGEALAGLHPSVVRDAVRSLAVLGAAHLMPGDRFPSVEFLENLTLGVIWNFEKKQRSAEEDRWFKLLEHAGYSHTSDFDRAILKSLRAGHVDAEDLLQYAAPLSAEAFGEDRIGALRAAGHRFWRSLDNGEEALADYQAKVEAAADVIGIGDVHAVYEVLWNLGQRGEADHLLQKFLDANRNCPGKFDLQHERMFGTKFQPRFAELVEGSSVAAKKVEPLRDVLDRIEIDRSWNRDDVVRVAHADFGELQALVAEAQGPVFYERFNTLLKIGSLPEASDAQREISAQALVWLNELMSDPVGAIRYARFLPRPTDATPA